MIQSMEAPEFIEACVNFSSPQLAEQFVAFMGKERPEFEDEVEPEYLSWFDLLNDWPYPAELEVRDCGVCVSWDHSWLTVEDIGKLNQLNEVELVAAWFIDKGVEHGDEELYGEEDPMFGFYHRIVDGQLTRIKLADRKLSTGYELKYGDESSQFENFWELRKSYLAERAQ